MRVAFRPAFDDSRPAVDHPLVRTHPETCRKSLYLGNHSTHLVGLSAEEGAALLGELLNEFDKLSSKDTHPESAGFFGKVRELLGGRAGSN